MDGGQDVGDGSTAHGHGLSWDRVGGPCTPWLGGGLCAFARSRPIGPDGGDLVGIWAEAVHVLNFLLEGCGYVMNE